MIKRLLVLSVVCLLLVNCSNKKEGIINNDSFVDILVDLHIYDAMFDIRSSVLKDDDGSWELYAIVFEKHGCTVDQFQESLKYYVANPEEFNEIYDAVISKLQITNDGFNRKELITKDRLIQEELK